MSSEKIPCTVAILTRNNGTTLKRALRSVRNFSEIIVCDGGSTDGTLDIARVFGTRIISQDSQYLDGEGRLLNWSGVRNQTLKAATYNWFFFLDSDEYLSQELVEEIRRVVAGEPAAFWVPRHYVYKGKVIRCAVTYPSVQMRLFSRLVANQFAKEVHERIELKEGIAPRMLQAAMLVPLPDDVGDMLARWRRYLAIEKVRRAPMSLWQWLRVAVHEGGVAGLYIVRLLRIRLFCRGNKLPVRFELARVWYQWALVCGSWSSVRL